MLPQYDTKLFGEIYTSPEDFLNDWKESGIYLNTLKTVGQTEVPIVSDKSIQLIFFLIYSKYGNNPIANYDVTQFQYKLWSIIFQYGPTWEKRKEIQDKLRNLSDDELFTGTKMIYNHAFNPSTAPSTDTLEELQAINDQNTTKTKKGKLEGYTQLWEMLATDVTADFLNKFSVCFKKFVRPERTHIFVTEVDDNE